MEIMIIDFILCLVTTLAIMCLAITYVKWKGAEKWKNIMK